MKETKYIIYFLRVIGVLLLIYSIFDIYKLFLNKSNGIAIFLIVFAFVLFSFAHALYNLSYLFEVEMQNEQKLIDNGKRIFAAYEKVIACSEEVGYESCRIICSYVDSITNNIYKFHSDEIDYKSNDVFSAITQMGKYEFLVYCDEQDYNKYVMDISDLKKWLDENIIYDEEF